MDPKATPLEAGLAIIYGTFVKYAVGEDGGDATTISKKDVAKMLKEQLPHIADNNAATEMMERLDADKDGTLDFMEYCTMIMGLCMVLHILVSSQE